MAEANGLPDTEADIIQRMHERSDNYLPTPVDCKEEPDIEWAYGPLKEFTRMVVHDFSKLFMLNADGGLGKTYTVKQTLRESLGPEGVGAHSLDDDERGWIYKAGHTTPLALFESLWEARHGDILFLDDMSGITKNDKAVEMLKAATDTDGETNKVVYESSRTPELGPQNKKVDNFTFRGGIIMSFNDTPDDNNHFNALEDRAAGGSAYELTFSYDERIRLLEEIAKSDDISNLPYETRMNMVDWIKTVTDPSMAPSIRTLKSVLDAREYAASMSHDVDWEQMCFEAFDFNRELYLIYTLMQRDIPVKEETAGPNEDSQVGLFKAKTGKSSGYYFDKKSELRSQLNQL